MQDASRRSSDPALHEGRTLLGAGGAVASVFLESRAPAHLSTLSKYSQSWLQFWRGSGAHAQWRRSSERILARCQLKRNTSRFSSAADQDSDWAAPHAAHSTHPQRVPWNCHCGARDESEGGLGGSSQGTLEPATTPVPTVDISEPHEGSS